MRDKGLDKGLIRYFDDSLKAKRGQDKNFFGFRKMYRDYLTKLNVAFYDTCCADATPEGIVPLRYNNSTDTIQFFNPATETWQTAPLVTGTVDLNGSELILDADADTSFTADTDDQIDIRIAGADDFRFTANTFTAILGSTIATDTIAETTAAAGVTVDGALIKDGGITANSMFAGFYPTAVTNNITAGTGGAISVTNYFTTINTDAGGDAFTLANGTQIGQLKLIRLVADGGGDGVVTPTSLSGGTTITFNDAGDEAELLWNGTAWVVIKNLGVTVA